MLVHVILSLKKLKKGTLLILYYSFNYQKDLIVGFYSLIFINLSNISLRYEFTFHLISPLEAHPVRIHLNTNEVAVVMPLLQKLMQFLYLM